MSKKKKIVISFIYLIISYMIFYLCVNKFSFLHYSNDLFLLFTIADIFLLCNIIFSKKKLYDFIYNKRFIIGIILLTFVVFLKYSGSSIELWNGIIQPESQVKSNIILGKPRPIRSDEWLVSSPLALTQATQNIRFSSNNSILGAKDNLVMLYPNLPSKDISILATPNNIGYLFLDVERAFSLSWFLPYFVLFFSSFELLMILTKGKKMYSLTGTVLITLSPVVQWWQSPSIPAYGSLAIVLFYHFLNTKSSKKKLLLSILFGYSGFLYIMCLYPAWQVTYAYVYLILLIWLLAQNKNKLKKIDLLYLIPVLLVIFIPICVIFIKNNDVLKIVSSTVYPGARMSTGGGEWRTLFSYVINIFYPYYDIGNPCEFSQYISLFPIPTIAAIYLVVKNEKKDLFLILSSIIVVMLTLWIIFPWPPIFSKISLLSMSTEMRAQVTVGYLSIIQLIYIISHFEKNEKNINILNFATIIFISLLCTTVIIKISNGVINNYFSSYATLEKSLISLIIFTIIIALFIYNNKTTNKILCCLLIITSLVAGAIVSPISKGLDVFFDKPLSSEIKEIVNKNSDTVFMASDSGITLANYIAVLGARTINTTNFVPNLELYEVLDPEKEYNSVYNRYEHVAINLTDVPTNFILNQSDYITINLNYSDICKISVDYIVTNTEQLSKYNMFKNVYSEGNINIFETGC